ncbi:MAG: hypothetical protein L6R36_006524 [Xanthoria steineri]|nr:MAG: hypothetical protein L6R36_006524 [Xanthoria steineri]
MILLNQGCGARRPSGTFVKPLQENTRKYPPVTTARLKSPYVGNDQDPTYADVLDTAGDLFESGIDGQRYTWTSIAFLNRRRDKGDATAEALWMIALTRMPPCHSRSQSSAASSSAPLPSPSANQPAQYFLQQAQSRNPPPPTSQAQPSSSQQAPGHVQGAQDSSIAKQDFCLIAEAAKRAQMAVLMRDLGEVSL